MEKAICLLVSDLNADMAYYGELCLFINFHHDDKIPTMGVNFQNNRMNLYWNKDFVESLSEKELTFVLIHEIYHLLWGHTLRTGTRDRNASNIAQDMIINKVIKDFIPSKYATMPCDETGKPNGITLPPEYKGLEVFENVYEWLKENAKDEDKGKGGGEGEGDYEFDHHFDNDDIPQEIKESIMKEVTDTLKAMGKETQGIEGMLKALRPKKSMSLEKLLKYVAELKGTIRTPSYRRSNRKGLPTRGKIGKQSEITCVLDTSGSMSNDMEKVLGYIFRNNITINLIQCDTKIHSVTKVSSKGQLSKTKIKGYGGTEIQPAIAYASKSLNRFPILVLTDGYTDSLDFSAFKKALVLTTGKKCPITSGKVKQVVIK